MERAPRRPAGRKPRDHRPGRALASRPVSSAASRHRRAIADSKRGQRSTVLSESSASLGPSPPSLYSTPPVPPFAPLMPAALTQSSIIAAVVSQLLATTDTVTVTLYGQHKLVASVMEDNQVFISLENNLDVVTQRSLLALRLDFDTRAKIEETADRIAIVALLVPVDRLKVGLESMADLVARDFVDFRIQSV